MKQILAISAMLLLSISLHGQVSWKKRAGQKAEEKADQVIDNLFKKKKKKTSTGTTTTPTPSSDSQPVESTPSADEFTPEPVDYSTLNLGSSIPFRTLINMLPEETNGFIREGKPEGSTLKMQGTTYSVASKQYNNGSSELEIMLYDYLGAESYATAMSAGQFEYESTEGSSKSIDIDGMTGWVTQDFESRESNLMLFKDGRFWLAISGQDLNEETLTAIAKDIPLDKLKAPE